MYDENNATSTGNHWVQIDNICVPYIIKSQQTRLLPYQVILDCDLLNHEEDRFLRHFTVAANANDIQTFERIIASSSSIEFRLAQDLLLIDLYHLIFGMSKVSYVKLLQQHKDVNKGYKTYDPFSVLKNSNTKDSLWSFAGFWHTMEERFVFVHTRYLSYV